MSLKVAISPCPNDTFLFHAWIKGIVGREVKPEPTFADIETLNSWALKEKFPLTKVSFGCFKHLIGKYQLLPVGSALGFGCGPKIIAKTAFSIKELKDKKVAIPGAHTTAALLFDRLIGTCKSKHYCLYHEISTLISQNQVDCGLIIHETRFTFEKEGFVEIADLGVLWEKQYQVPLPLGAIAVKSSLPNTQKTHLIHVLQESLRYARAHKTDESTSFIQSQAQDKDPEVILKHIDTYVNSETEQLSAKGEEAIRILLDEPSSKDWIYG